VSEANDTIPRNLPIPRTPEALGKQSRMAIQLLACGYDDDEVAKTVGMDLGRLKVLKRSPMFRLEVTKAEKLWLDNHGKQVRDMMRQHNKRAVETVAEVMNDVEQPGTTRVQAARVFLDREVPLKEDRGAAAPQIIININPGDEAHIESVLTEATTVLEDSPVVEATCSDGGNTDDSDGEVSRA
jgi:hypothetical protein